MHSMQREGGAIGLWTNQYNHDTHTLDGGIHENWYALILVMPTKLLISLPNPRAVTTVDMCMSATLSSASSKITHFQLPWNYWLKPHLGQYFYKITLGMIQNTWPFW